MVPTPVRGRDLKEDRKGKNNRSIVGRLFWGYTPRLVKAVHRRIGQLAHHSPPGYTVVVVVVVVVVVAVQIPVVRVVTALVSQAVKLMPLATVPFTSV